MNLDLKIDGDIELSVNMDPAILEFGEISMEDLFSTRLGYETANVITKDEFESFEKESVIEILKMLRFQNYHQINSKFDKGDVLYQKISHKVLSNT